MIIDIMEVFYIVLPLKQPWRTAYGEDHEIHSVLVRLVSGEFEGWGEGTPFFAPTYSSETATSSYFLNSEIFAPILVGHEFNCAEELLVAISPFKRNPFAKAAVESAWWSLEAASTKQPMHRLFGGEYRPLKAGADFGVQNTFDELLEKIQEAVDRGFHRIKLKVRPGWDLDMLNVVRPTFPDLTIHVDCNATYTLDDLPLFQAMDELNLAMIEQPLADDNLYDHAELQRQIQTPICLDESVKSVRDFETALRLGACRVLNIKYGRVGGLTSAVRLHNIALEACVPCWVGGMLESGIGAGINIELATLTNFSYPGDLFESRRFYQKDLVEPEIVMNADCTFTPTSAPGTPYRPVPERVDQVTKYKKTIGKNWG